MLFSSSGVAVEQVKYTRVLHCLGISQVVVAVGFLQLLHRLAGFRGTADDSALPWEAPKHY